jgi:HD-like signal output (HDOD) protein
MRTLWRHSLGCAMGSNWLAKKCGLNGLAHEAFFAGLLHDVGKLFILTVIDDLKHSDDLDIQPSDALLLEAMNSLHANHGYSLMVRWNLPEKYCNIVRDHHNEEFDSKDMLQNLVRLADKACLKRGIGMVENPALVLVTTVEADALHVSEVDLAQMEIMLEDSQVMAN